MDDSMVFLVDDDLGSLKAMARFLRATGLNVTEFESASDFLLHHDIRIPGCAVLDVALGDGNGVDVYCTLTRAGHRRPTIFITGRRDVPTGVRAMEAGAVALLIKPVQHEELIAAIYKAIGLDLQEREEEARGTSAVVKLTGAKLAREHAISGSEPLQFRSAVWGKGPINSAN